MLALSARSCSRQVHTAASKYTPDLLHARAKYTPSLPSALRIASLRALSTHHAVSFQTLRRRDIRHGRYWPGVWDMCLFAMALQLT
eukprot:2667628-Rhodomonas_salina.1